MTAKDKKKSTQVKRGINQPPPVSDDAAGRFKSSRLQELAADEYVQGILAGERVILSRAITLSGTRITWCSNERLSLKRS